MEKIMDRLCRQLEENKYRFRRFNAPDGTEGITLTFKGHNLDGVKVHVRADRDNASFAVRCFDVCKVPEGRRAALEHLINELNCKRRWFHFYIDPEGSVNAACDAIVAPATAGPVGQELILRCVGAVDDCYPDLMKELWG